MVTVISTVPTLPTGEVAVMEVAVLPVMEAEVFPNFTAVAPVKLVPVMVTVVPPAVGPLLGLMLTRAGTCACTAVLQPACSISSATAARMGARRHAGGGLAAPGLLFKHLDRKKRHIGNKTKRSAGLKAKSGGICMQWPQTVSLSAKKRLQIEGEEMYQSYSTWHVLGITEIGDIWR